MPHMPKVYPTHAIDLVWHTHQLSADYKSAAFLHPAFVLIPLSPGSRCSTSWVSSSIIGPTMRLHRPLVRLTVKLTMPLYTDAKGSSCIRGRKGCMEGKALAVDSHNTIILVCILASRICYLPRVYPLLSHALARRAANVYPLRQDVA